MDAVRAAADWEIRAADAVTETAQPTARELEVLRELNRKTAEAHGRQVAE
jgi:glutaconate CoA-transferase subunit B